jgi:MoxR-like ATPase
MKIKEQIEKLLNTLNEGVYEKHEVTALSLLTAIAGESIFLLGAPGVAKSLIARRLKFAFKEGKSFEYLMNRFSTPDEIFGPVSITELKNDKYERIVKNYLPDATVVFLDEIWKAGPSIQNALLTVLNEKVYRNGDQEIKLPMKALISASNELPMKDQGLEALWDRFLVRYVVEGVTNKENFNEMISKSLKSYEDNISPRLKLTDEQYVSISIEIDKVEIPENVFHVIHVIRNYINEHNAKLKEDKNDKEELMYVSDRRWKKIIRLLRTSAFLNERGAVDLMDCFLIPHCIWNEPSQFESVLQFTKDAVQKHGYKLAIDLKDLREEIREFSNEVKEETSYLKPILRIQLKTYDTEYLYVKDYNEYYIKASDFKSLNSKDYIAIQLYSKSQRGYSRQESKNCKKGKGKFTIDIGSSYYGNDADLCKLETEDYEEQISATKKAHHATQKHWDKEVSKFLTIASNLKSQIEHFRKEDLKHIRVNLFVKPSFAEIVESNLNETEKAINKIEVEINSIQHNYENIEDQTTKEVKQLTNGEVNE